MCRINPRFLLIRCAIGMPVVFLLMLVVFTTGRPSSAIAAPSLVYQYYVSEGMRAFENHDDEAAARYFKRAIALMPSAQEPHQYLKVIEERETPSENSTPAGAGQDQYSSAYSILMRRGKEALSAQQYQQALEFFYQAHLISPNAQDSLEYINLAMRLRDDRTVVVGEPSARESEKTGLPEAGGTIPAKRMQVVSSALEQYLKRVNPASEPVLKSKPLKTLPVVTAHSTVEKKSEQSSQRSSVTKKNDVKEPLMLAEAVKVSQAHSGLRVDVGDFLLLEGRNIKRFLIVEQGIIEADITDRDHIRIAGRKRGKTFIHIWDDAGRSTLYMETVWPQSREDAAAKKESLLEHAQPFHLNYSNDWGAYYYGPDVSGMQRRSINFLQNVGIDGETPYGFFDASLSASGYGDNIDIPTYTMGLSGIPLEHTSDFDVRIFDASRNTSPLTFPGARLRGIFSDINILDEAVGLSGSWGQQQSIFVYSYPGRAVALDSYIQSAKVTLFPKDDKKQYSLNYASAYGAEHASYLSKQAYSIQGQHKIDKTTLNAELARSVNRNAVLGGVLWEDAGFQTALRFRDINPQFTTVVSAPSNQGEIGGTWTTRTDRNKFSMNTAVDVYQDRLYYNQNDPEALNYDSSAYARLVLTDSVWIDANARYSDANGIASPSQYGSASARLNKGVKVWGNRQATLYTGASYQESRYAGSSSSEYDRCAATVGVMVPVTRALSCFANYEYSWLYEPASRQRYNPNVFNTGINFNTDIGDKVSTNVSVAYRNEAKAGGSNSFLSGEDSVTGSAGLTYAPDKDVSYFLDGRLRDVWAQIPDNPSYNDLDVRFGMRARWGVPVRLDPQGVVAGVVFKDKNMDGKFNPGDVGIPGVKVKIGEQDVITDERGYYGLPVRAKKVLVAPVLETIPSGFVFSTPMFAKVAVVQGKTRRTDFGLTSQSGIYGVVFIDKNGNNAPDSGDQFVAKVKFILDDKQVQVTGGQGTYFFRNVASGKHLLTLDMKTLPSGLLPAVKIKNEITVVEGTTYVFHVPMKVQDKVKSIPPPLKNNNAL